MSVLIIAPHVDDELIGCYSILVNQDKYRPLLVGYGELHNPNRRMEAAKAAETFNFEFCLEQNLTFDLLKPWTKIFVPSITDHHVEHKTLNRKWRRLATHFYSITNLDQGTPLSDNDATMKRVLLDVTYPSQRELWAKDAKYYLFENIKERDFEVYTTYHYAGVSITCLDKFKLPPLHIRNLSDRDLVNQVLTICNEGKVTIAYNGRTIEVNQ